MRNQWAGVRPIRYRNEIFGVIQTIVRMRTGVAIRDIQARLLEERAHRDNTRINLLQRAGSLENYRRKREIFVTKAEQMVRVFKALDIIRNDGHGYSATKKALQLSRLNELDHIDANSAFLELLLDSRYETYKRFLGRLKERGRLDIPKTLIPRSKEISVDLKRYLGRKGFLMDSWSLFFMRDLFYDFGLLNYFFTTEMMSIIPLYQFSTDRRYEHRIKLSEDTISFWPRVALNTFIKQLQPVYLQMTDNNWNRIVSIIRLREQFSIKYRIPEQEFNLLLMRAVKTKANYRVILSVGVLDPSEVTASVVKALNLPTNRYGLPYTLGRFELSEGRR